MRLSSNLGETLLLTLMRQRQLLSLKQSLATNAELDNKTEIVIPEAKLPTALFRKRSQLENMLTLDITAEAGLREI